MSVHDPEMLHGRKRSSKRFDGHKAAIGVDSVSLFGGRTFEAHSPVLSAETSETCMKRVHFHGSSP